MVKTPKTRHFKPKRARVTIDLQATPADESETKSTAKAEAKAKPTTLDEAETPAQAGGFEPWLTPDQKTVPGEDVQAGDADKTEIVEAASGDATLAAEDTRVEERFDYDSEPGPDAPPSDTGDVQPGIATSTAGSAYETEANEKPAPRETSWNESPPPAARQGGMSAWLAGLIGALIALLGAGALQFAGLLGSPGGGQADNAGLAALQTEIGSLRTELDTLKNAGGGDAAAVAGLNSSLDQVKADIAALQSAVQAGGAGDAAAVGALDEKVRAVEAAVAQLAQAPGGATDEELAAVGGKVAAVEQAVATLTAKVDAQAAQPKIALAISAAALKSALDRGSPFGAELETFAAIAPNAPEVEPLRKFSEAGVMTKTDIAKAFPDAANAMAAASEPVAEDAGFFQRLLSSAESVVKVRPVGEVPGEDPPARIARMEVAVNAGDYDKALAEFAALPAPVQAAGADLVDKIKARVDVEKLVDQMIAGAMKAA